MKRNFKKIALAASFAAFGCNSFVNASLTGNVLKAGAIILAAKAIWDTSGLGDYSKLNLLLKDERYTRREADQVPPVFRNGKGEYVKPSDKLKKLVQTNESKWIGNKDIAIDDLTLWQLVKDAAKQESRGKYTGETLKAIMSDVYGAMREHKIINFEINKNLKIVKTLPAITIEE